MMKNWKSIPFIRIIVVIAILFFFYYVLRGLILKFDPLCQFDRYFICTGCIFIPFIFIYFLIASYSKIEQTCKRRKCVSDIIYSTPYSVRPIIQDIFHSFFRRPAGGLIGIILTILITLSAIYLVQNDNAFSTGLGIAGVIFGILSYHVSQRVEHSIRDSIVDFREFLKVVSRILEEEIICEKQCIKKFINAEQMSDTHALDIPDCADLILLLWLPSYNFTKDFKGIGNKLDSQLKQVKALTCRSYLITSENENSIIRFFDKRYNERSKNYDENTLHSYLDQVDQDPDRKRQIFDTTFPHSSESNKLDAPNANLFHSLENLYTLYDDRASPYWSVNRKENNKLMDRLIQLIWTPKKAAIVFMPPDSDEKNAVANDESNKNSISPVYSSISPYQCSGFVTEDAFMISMIRDIIQIQYEI